MKIAYLVNQYPKVSHSFIRREIIALENQGIAIERVSVRGWDIPLADQLDEQEKLKTTYILQNGLIALVLAFLRAVICSPFGILKSFITCIKLSYRSDRSLIFHLIYLLEACQLFIIAKRSSVTHIHAHFGTNSTEVALLASLIGGMTYSFTLHGPEELDKPEFIKLAQKVELSSFVVAISSYCRSQIFRWIKNDQWAKVKEVHCGIETAFYDIPDVAIPNKPRLVCIGRLCEQKGQLLLIDAASILAKRGVDFELVLGGDGELRTEIEQKIKAYGLEKQIHITGWISSESVRDEILASKGMILPSFAEGLPVVIMEAMALKRPVLSTYIAGIPELVIDGDTGLLFPAGDVELLADVMQEFLGLPLDKLEKMGASAYQRVLLRHSVEIEAKKLASLFLEVSESTQK